MRLWWLLLVTPALAGCTEEGGFLPAIFGDDDGLDGVCGHVHRGAWEEQIILQVELGPNASKAVDVTDVSISASHHDGSRLQGYDRDRSPDEQGCVAFPLRGEGGYFFLGLAFREGSSACYVKGQFGGEYSGEFEVAQGKMYVVASSAC